jgi:hypothetical protein
MLPLEHLSASVLLLEYATYSGANYLHHLAEYISGLGYRKYTCRHPGGRDISKHDIRRLLHKLLRELPEYQPDRPLTRCHQDLLKAAILARKGKGELQ